MKRGVTSVDRNASLFRANGMERHLERRIEQPSLPVAVFEGDAGDPRTAVPVLNPQDSRTSLSKLVARGLLAPTEPYRDDSCADFYCDERLSA